MTLIPSVLTGILCIMSMFAANADRIGWNQLPISLGMGIIVGLVFSVLFNLHSLTGKSSAVISSVFTACFFLWYAITPWASVGILIVALTLAIVFRKRNVNKATKPLTLILLFAILASTGQALITTDWQVASAKSEIQPRQDKLPNVYFIIPDRMPSIDAMTESGIDSTEFVANLRSMGFYIKPDQLSHDEFTPFYQDYVTASRTMRFLASVLNMNADVGLQTSYKVIFNMIRNPAIIDELHSLGYEYHHVGSWFTETSYCPNADKNYIYEGSTFLETIMRHEFTNDVFDRSILRGLNIGVFWKNVIGDVSRERLIYQTNSILSVAEKGNQHFVFAHLILPHEPFTFAVDGSIQTNKALSQPELYYEQVKFAMVYLQKLASGILQADPTAIILIQSDEGMAYHSPIYLNLELSNTQWNGVLTAWRVPGADESELSGLKHTEILKWLVEWLKR